VLDFSLDTISSRPSTYLALAEIVLIDDFVFFAPGDTAMITPGDQSQPTAGCSCTS
jgi:hypothetical protein